MSRTLRALLANMVGGCFPALRGRMDGWTEWMEWNGMEWNGSN